MKDTASRRDDVVRQGPGSRRSFAIRRANSNDGQAILNCLLRAFAPYRDRYTPAAFEDTVLTSESVQRRLREMSVFVAESNGEVVGTIGCSGGGGDGGHLRGMAVLPDWQGTEVASALLQAAETELRNHGHSRVTLDTTAPLTRAMRFYERHGFARSGRVSDFFGMVLHEYVKSL
jgi:GNAT superfamily N-acetyltransferase